jgi:hypothetical protein
MSLDTDAFAIGVAARALRGSCSEYHARFRTATETFQREWPAANRAMFAYTLIPGIPNIIGIARVAGVVDPALAALASRIAPPVGAAARTLMRMNNDLVTRMATLQGVLNQARTALSSQKTAENVAAALLDGADASNLAQQFIALHRRSMWSTYDPRETPLVLMAFQTPGGVPVRQWVNSLYTALAGEEYAAANPLPGGNDTPPPPRQTPWPTILSLAAGTVGGFLIIRALRNR